MPPPPHAAQEGQSQGMYQQGLVPGGGERDLQGEKGICRVLRGPGGGQGCLREGFAVLSLLQPRDVRFYVRQALQPQACVAGTQHPWGHVALQGRLWGEEPLRCQGARPAVQDTCGTGARKGASAPIPNTALTRPYPLELPAVIPRHPSSPQLLSVCEQ